MESYWREKRKRRVKWDTKIYIIHSQIYAGKGVSFPILLCPTKEGNSYEIGDNSILEVWSRIGCYSLRIKSINGGIESSSGIFPYAKIKFVSDSVYKNYMVLFFSTALRLMLSPLSLHEPFLNETKLNRKCLVLFFDDVWNRNAVNEENQALLYFQ